MQQSPNSSEAFDLLRMPSCKSLLNPSARAIRTSCVFFCSCLLGSRSQRGNRHRRQAIDEAAFRSLLEHSHSWHPRSKRAPCWNISLCLSRTVACKVFPEDRVRAEIDSYSVALLRLPPTAEKIWWRELGQFYARASRGETNLRPPSEAGWLVREVRQGLPNFETKCYVKAAVTSMYVFRMSFSPRGLTSSLFCIP